MDYLNVINKADELASKGEFVKAIEVYEDVLADLDQKAGEYSRKFDDTHTDNETTRTILPKFFPRAKEYHMNNGYASTIYAKMAKIYEMKGDIESVKILLKNADDLKPTSK